MVCDMSSDILTRHVNVSDYGVIFAGAQKNMGCAGVTTVIIREDLVGLGCKGLVTPIMLDYQTAVKNKSLYNTPSTFSIYVCGLVTKWAIQNGGLDKLVRECDEKSALVYGCIGKSEGFFRSCIERVEFQSRVNIVFRISRKGMVEEFLEEEFVKEAEELGMIQLKGHRSVGGIRVSIYNACPVEDVIYLVKFMEKFASIRKFIE